MSLLTKEMKILLLVLLLGVLIFLLFLGTETAQNLGRRLLLFSPYFPPYETQMRSFLVLPRL